MATWNSYSLPTPYKSLIVVAVALATLAAVYIIAAASLNLFPFLTPATEVPQTVEPLVDVPSPNLPQDAGPGAGVEVPPLPTNTPTSPVTPQIPPNTDVGSGAGGSGRPTSVPPSQGDQVLNQQPTPTLPIPQNTGQPTVVSPEPGEDNQPTLAPVPTPSATPNPGGGGGGGFPAANDDDDGGGTPNQSPTALDDSATVNEGGSVVIAVLSNDSDPDGDPLTVTGVTQGINGTVTFGASTVTYTHNGSQTGSDSFSYFIADPSAGAGTATVSITVNQSPVAED